MFCKEKSLMQTGQLFLKAPGRMGALQQHQKEQRHQVQKYTADATFRPTSSSQLVHLRCMPPHLPVKFNLQQNIIFATIHFLLFHEARPQASSKKRETLEIKWGSRPEFPQW